MLVSFDGEPWSDWDAWIGHFESVAQVNGWDDPSKLLCLQVRLTEKAQTAWNQLSGEDKQESCRAKAVLWNHCELYSGRDLYAAKLQVKCSRQGETWGGLPNHLRLLANKAFADLQSAAKEQMSMDWFLSLIEDPEAALCIKNGLKI